ncbi:lactate dehydrogenase [Aureimonas endophytica]|uniref:Delta(1)-pyrroline-2-carboxylate/Delta(1)-piperideine-2-carboxylate reductase n=1 Tax=Aureimonas endophytica TaxID=2027858 RepID=A0A917E7T4_9HYPH|nr:Ldh family oxidoreductase [Aureimonas endophytica]GGE12551.1 lactate dehydrogenase [Aureimonas endophytica]
MTRNSAQPERGDARNLDFLSFGELKALLARIFRHAGASEAVAECLAANCAGCERDGARSHGVFRMPGYVSSIASGWVDAAASPRLEDVAPAFLRADAMNGFAQPALALAAPALIEKARRNGIALLAIRNSHHFSALWPDVEPFAEAGLVALTMVNSFACTVPFDGTSAVFGTNPIAFAAPRDGAPPLVADLATSAMANGDVQIAAREGFSLPPGQGVDQDGRPTIDPKAVLDGGALLTFGGYKGSAISLMIELLGAALTGGKFSYEVDWSGHPGAQTPHTGQVLILIDPDAGRDAAFAGRARALAERLGRVGVSRLPGDRRFRQRARSAAEGIGLVPADLARLRALAGPA